MDNSQKLFLVELNSTDVGFAIVGKMTMESIDEAIQNMMTSMGFVDVRAYLESLPGYSNYLFPDYSINTQNIEYQINSCDKNCRQKFLIEFTNVETEFLNMSLLKYFFNYINNNLKGFMFCLLPTLAEVNSVDMFDDVKIAYKWFCSDWVAPISYWV